MSMPTVKAIEFANFKVARNAVLPLGQFSLLVGPNGSGKSTALQALQVFSGRWHPKRRDVCSVGCTEDQSVEVGLQWGGEFEGVRSFVRWAASGEPSTGRTKPNTVQRIDGDAINSLMRRIRVFTLNAADIQKPAPLQSEMEIQDNGMGLAAVLDRLRDIDVERWNSLNQELGRWFPDFDQITFDVIDRQKKLSLRLRRRGHLIPADALSQGTLIGLAILTIAYLPDPPHVVGFEELDHGLHPRLLRDVQQAVYRLAYPEQFSESRPPVQVIATTHSPYLLDLFKDYPEEIVICERDGDNVRYRRLSEMENIDEILQGSSLGDVWYSGALGGVPAAT